jgi:predicted NUDIX family NTP pyrophosphohydrolase
MTSRPPPVTSAGLLLYRAAPDGLALLLGHPGGPFWVRKDDGAWSIPKGEYGPDEEPAAAAIREFTEELGAPPPPGPLLPLGSVRLRTGKVITAFARAGDFDADRITPGTFDLEWPPRSGRLRSFPEIDRVAWFDPVTARHKLTAAQVPFVDRLLAALGSATG